MKILAPLVLLGGLAACTEPTGSYNTPPATGGNLNSVAAQACRAAIAQQTGKSIADVAVFDVVEAEAGVGVQATVAGAERPWSCQSSPTGQVAGVMYMGEG